MNGKCDVLMHTGIAPPHTLGFGIGAIVGRNRFQLPHLPLPFPDFLQIDPRTRHAFNLIIFVYAPPSEMVGTRNDTGRQPFCDPSVEDEETNLGVNLHQIAGSYMQSLRVHRIQPQRILV